MIDKYLANIGLRIQGRLDQGSCTLQELCRSCRGAYPTVVIEALKRLEGETGRCTLPGYTGIGTHNGRSLLANIEGNPILASWYFSDETCERIAHLRNWSSMRLAFLGTPRLFEWFADHDLGARRTLLDADQLVISILEGLKVRNGRNEAVLYDAAQELPAALQRSFDCVFFDPPWYENHYRVWFGRASALAPMGLVVFALFPELTRPSAEEERTRLLQYFRLVDSEPTMVRDACEYLIPSYESAELRAAGVEVLGPWKLADLVLGRLTGSELVDRDSMLPESASQWAEIDIDHLRIFVNLGTEQPGAEFLIAPGPSPVLKSPSRRNPLLRKVNVMSSRGHGLVASRPSEFLGLLRDVARRNREQRRTYIDSLGLDKNSKLLLRILVLGE